MPSPRVLGAISCYMTTGATRVARQLSDRLPCVGVGVDASWIHAILAKFALTFRRVFVEVAPRRVNIKAVLALAPAAKSANHALRIILDVTAVRMCVGTNNTPARAAVFADPVRRPRHLFHLRLQLFHKSRRDTIGWRRRWMHRRWRETRQCRHPWHGGGTARQCQREWGDRRWGGIDQSSRRWRRLLHAGTQSESVPQGRCCCSEARGQLDCRRWDRRGYERGLRRWPRSIHRGSWRNRSRWGWWRGSHRWAQHGTRSSWEVPCWKVPCWKRLGGRQPSARSG
mmetsp:Transcript_116676/g.291309  ORF Transcript_116676/g.291309 Transcript_116676/m.291309 type:complete len:284 (-) Transcript_116676:186-1037(-)